MNRFMRRAAPLALGALGGSPFLGSPALCCGCRQPTATPLCVLCVREADTGASFSRARDGHSRLGRYWTLSSHGERRITGLGRALIEFKYRGDRAKGHRLAKFFACHTPTLDQEVDIVVPVPLHPKKLRRRGFNQSAWLSRAAAQVLAVPHKAGALFRLHDHAAVATLPGFERARATPPGTFRASASVVQGQRVLLIDDVFTTGSTSRAAEHALSNAGARCVKLAVLLSA